MVIKNYSLKSDVVISVVVPCFNQGGFLRECVESIIAQNFSHWECIIVDDGSTDNTSKVADELVILDDRIKYFYKTNGGLSSARNYGIKHALGEFILPLDSDDYISENYLELAVCAIRKSSDNKVVFGVVRNFGFINETFNNKHDFVFEKQLISNQIHCSGLFRRYDALSIFGYDESMRSGFEDWEFYIRLLAFGGNAIQLEDIILYYRRKEVSMITSLLSDNRKLEVSNYLVTKNIALYNACNYDIISALVLQYKMSVPESLFSYRELICFLYKKMRRTFFRFKRK